MPLTLEAWQERLERHFSQIAESRPVDQFPIFALEHGLTSDELAEISTLLRQRVAMYEPLGPHWLLWVVYATELGYLYDGIDYWPPFYRTTPGWREHGRQSTLKEWFRRFQRKFNGVEPSGPWARHFNRIAWPITHAVLPKLLQVQFARALFDVSREVARARELDAASAGRILASNSYWYSSRFQEFLQQEELAGRIMLAMLDKKPAGDDNPLHPETLKRITDDVINVQEAGGYLRAAQRIVRDRFEGVHRSVITPMRSDDASAHGHRQAEPLSLEPTLILRRASEDTWTPVIELPSFSTVARLSPELTEFLKRVRCSIAGVGPTLFPPGFLLYGTQVRALKSWPASGENIIKFERGNPVIENLMRRDCRFSTNSVWVFRVGSDGIAREVVGRTVRADQRYVIASRDSIINENIPLRPIQIACAGVHAFELAMPEFIAPELTEALERIGVLVARNIKIWPAGLCVRNWDGEGRGDWLSSEVPCFGIVHDHAVDEYFLKLNNGPERRLEGARAREPLFVRLPHLAPGRHVLSVRAKRLGVTSRQALRDLEGQVELRVRDPLHWKPGIAAHSGLLVRTDPHDPNLDAFWEGSVAVEVEGPEGHEVTCTIALTSADGRTVLNEDIGRFALPIRPRQWLDRFRRFANDNNRAWRYLDAATGTLRIKGEELGQYILRLERDIKPVRWVCRIAAHESEIRLVDDTDSDTSVVAEFYSFRQPARPRPIDPESAHNGVPVNEPGGLYYAQQGQHRDALVVRNSGRAHGFAGLVVQPDFHDAGQDTKSLLQLLALAELWQEARLAGTLADDQRHRVVLGITNHIYSVLCGEHWIRTELAIVSDTESTLDRLKSSVGGNRSFGAVIATASEALAGQRTDQRLQWFCGVASRYGVSSDEAVTKFAFRLASSPIGILQEFGNDTESKLDSLRSMGILLRGARFLTLAVSHAESQQATTVREGS